METMSLEAAFDSFDEQWSPRVAGEVDDHAVKLVTVEAALSGTVTPRSTNCSSSARADRRSSSVSTASGAPEPPAVNLSPGELVGVPAGVEHRPVADGVVEILLFERTGTRNTGDAEDERTAEVGRLDGGGRSGEHSGEGYHGPEVAAADRSHRTPVHSVRP